MTGRDYARAWWLKHRNDELRIEAALAEAWEAGRADAWREARETLDTLGPAVDAMRSTMTKLDVKDVTMTSGRVRYPIGTEISVGTVPDYMKNRRARDRDKGEA